MRAFVRGWARGDERRAVVACVWLELSASGERPSERAVAAQCNVPLSSVRAWVRDFRRQLERARRREADMGTPIQAWVRPLVVAPDPE